MNLDASERGEIPEQELAVQVADVDRVHVDDMDILESRKSQI
jgi:hypothetical protein